MNLFKIKKNHLIVQRDQNNKLILDLNYIILALTVVIGSFIVQLINHYYFRFQGNNYIHSLGFFTSILYFTINIIGCRLLPEFQRFTSKFVDFLLIMITFLIISYATNSVQYTPFLPIDNYLYRFEFLKLESLVNFLNQHQDLKIYLILVYNSLVSVMMGSPLILVFFNRRQEIHNFCRFLLFSVIIGFGIYYFLPSCGPASVFNPQIFMDAQHANHIKFWEIHQNKLPSTLDGGLIAFPSFHVILAWACCRIFKTINTYIYYALMIWFILICVSCLLLGWHYSIDIAMSLIIILSLEKIWVTQ